MTKKQLSKLIKEKFPYISEYRGTTDTFEFIHDEIVDFIYQLLTKKIQDLLKQMMEECNKTENEAGRLLVKKFIK